MTAAILASGALLLILYLAIVVFMIASMWKVFVKAGQPGWGCLIPIYNTYLMTQIGGLEIIWFIFTFIPILNIVAAFKISFAIAENFGKSTGFGLGLVFLGFIFFPILAFGSAQYRGRMVAVPPAPPAEPSAVPPSETPGGTV